MSLRTWVGETLLRVGDTIKDLPVAVLRPADMSEWARERYDRASSTWHQLNSPDQGLTEDEQELWAVARTVAPPGTSRRILVLGGGGGAVRRSFSLVMAGWLPSLTSPRACWQGPGRWPYPAISRLRRFTETWPRSTCLPILLRACGPRCFCTRSFSAVLGVLPCFTASGASLSREVVWSSRFTATRGPGSVRAGIGFAA